MTEIVSPPGRVRKPAWIRVKAPTSPGYHATRKLMRAKQLHTVCEEAACPNIGECWAQGHATVMILGDTCTRACSFCNIKTGLPQGVDLQEPVHLAEALAELGLKHVVITSVDRDDLPDGGAFQFAACIRRIRATTPERAISSGTKCSRITPLLGDAFLISAITPALPWAIFVSIALTKPRAGACSAARCLRSARDTRALRSAISSHLRAIILRNTVGVSDMKTSQYVIANNL
jgi:hypothetical protein